MSDPAPKEEQQWPDEPPRLSEDELKELARNVVTNVVFITNTLEGIQNSFGMVLMLIPPGGGAESYMAKTGALYEEWSKQAPRSVNGRPQFFSFKAVHVDDLEPLLTEIERMEVALGITRDIQDGPPDEA